MGLFKYNYRITLAFLHDIFWGAISFLVALALRYSVTQHNFIEHIPKLEQKFLIVVSCQALVFTFLGLYRGVWRFSSTHDLKQIIKASFLTTLLVTALLFASDNMSLIPRTSLAIYFCFLILSTGGGRFVYRLYKESFKRGKGNETLIIGAGAGAEQLIRDIKRNSYYKYKIIGLLDDNLHLKGRAIHGIKVIGTTKCLEKLPQRNSIKHVFIAIPSASSADLRRIVMTCKALKNAEVKTLPSMQDIINGRVNISSLRQVELEDLLGREPIELDLNSIGKMLTAKSILITGAGGSIGSELSLQVSKFAPSQLILLDISEFQLYEIERKLRGQFKGLKIVPIVADIRDQKRLNSIFKKLKIDIVYHAAAYKQVPLMEHNYQEAVLTNIKGTLNLANTAIQHNVSRFVMVSTDKAVNPTNVMGASKRIAEMVCQELSQNKTRFTTVRFGNVLGSRGSVIPLFEEQIKNGGPVTVTHKDITRYFMSIPEASQLILQAGSMGFGGEIFILEMGEPVKIYELAVQMISLTGLKPFEDIDIKITGLRPGEKLYEELLADEENTLKTPHPSVRVACARTVSPDLLKKIEALIESVYDTPANEYKMLLKDCVAEYTPDLKVKDPNSSVTFQ